MIFSRGKVRVHPNFCLENTAIEVVYEFKYLGVTFNYNGRFIKTIVQQTRKASKAMFDILKKQSEMNLDMSTMFKLFDTCALPVATYGCETWGFEDLQVLEKLHLKFCKLLLNVKRSTSSMVYGETGRYPVSLVVFERIIGFWFRLSTSNEQKLSVLMYRFLALSNSENPWFVGQKAAMYPWSESCLAVSSTGSRLSLAKTQVYYSLAFEFVPGPLVLGSAVGCQLSLLCESLL